MDSRANADHAKTSEALSCPDPGQGHTGRMDRPGYAERRSYAVPESLGDLAGPRHGVSRLPELIAWTGRTEYDLDDEADRAVF